MPRKSLNPEAPWDWVRISEAVQAAFEQAKQRARGKLNQTDFGRPYGFTQGEISKLINRKFSEPSIKIEKGLTVMLGRIPRLAIAELPDPDEQSQPRRDDGDPAELQRGISLLRKLYRNRRHQEQYWSAAMAVLEEADRSREPKRVRKP